MSKLQTVKTNVETGKTKRVPDLVQEALDAGERPQSILDAMVEAMGVVGENFSAGTLFVPEMLIAAKAMSRGVEVLKPHLASRDAARLGSCVIGTVQGDLHDIGKNLVAMMMESAGFNLVDLGVDVPAARFIEAIKTGKGVRLVACSGLLSTTMPAMRDTVAAIKQSGLTGFKVMVGGAPVTQAFADEIGADAYAQDAGAAAAMAQKMVTAVS